MNKKIGLMVLLGAVLAGGYWASGYLVERDGGDQLLLYGNVDIREVQLGFRTAGRLRNMLYEEGDAVAPGDLLATLDDQPQREALAVAEARVLEARARLDRAQTGSRPQEIQQAEAGVAEAQAAMDNAERELHRQRELTEARLSSQRLLDTAVATRDQAAARLDASREVLALAVEGSRQEDIAAAQAALAAATAQRDQAKTQLADTRLYAPSAGVIFTRAREPGAMLGVGSAVYTLSLTETIYVRAYAAESDLGRVVPGTAVLVRSDSFDTGYPGQVGFVSPRAEFTPKTVETPQLRTDLVYRLRIVVDNSDQGLRQGMPVTVEIAAP